MYANLSVCKICLFCDVTHNRSSEYPISRMGYSELHQWLAFPQTNNSFVDFDIYQVATG